MTDLNRFRVFADSNDRTGDGDYQLIFEQSANDLAAMGEALREGARVTLYMTDEYEVEGVLIFSAEAGFWLARPDYATIRYLDGTKS